MILIGVLSSRAEVIFRVKCYTYWSNVKVRSYTIWFFAVDGETFKNTSWVNHFETQSVEIGNLGPELYEFKTVARNDYPDRDNPEQSPSSDVTDGRPLPGIVSKSSYFSNIYEGYVSETKMKFKV